MDGGYFLAEISANSILIEHLEQMGGFSPLYVEEFILIHFHFK